MKTGELDKEIRWLKVHFSRAFPLLTDYGAVSFGGAARFIVIDWDLDGKKDLLVGGTRGRVVFYRNLGGEGANPHFAEGLEIVRIPNYISTPIVVDWNHDEVRDLLVAGRDSFIYIFINRGTNEEPRFEFTGPLRDKESVIFSVDFPRWLVPPRSPEEIRRMEDAPRYLDPEFHNYLDPVICDWIGDGGNDLLIGDSSGAIWFLEDVTHGKGTPQFEGKHYTKTGLKGYRNSGKYINKYGNQFSKPFRVLTYKNGQVVKLGKGVAYGKPVHGFMAKPRVVDWDGDGDKDLLVASGLLKGHIDFLENVNPDPRGKPQLVFRGPVLADGKPIEINFHGHFFVCDWDRDGHRDLLVSAGPPCFPWICSSIYVYKNVADNGSIPELTLVGPLTDKDVPLAAEFVGSVIDWDENGLNDFIEGNMEGYIYLRKNVGTKTEPKYDFETIPLLDQDGPIRVSGETDPKMGKEGGVGFPIVCDWNGDGKLDLLVGTDTGHIYYYRGLGKGEEAFPRRFVRVGPLRDNTGKEIKVHNRCQPTVVDWNGNGRLDLLVIGSTCQMGFSTDPTPGGEIQFFENEGTGDHDNPILAPGKILQVDGNPFTFGPSQKKALCAVDVDKDGKPELMIATSKLGIRMIKNVGSLEKPELTLSPRLGGSWFDTLGDVNGDGYADLVCGGGESAKGFYRLNLNGCPME